MKMKYLLFISIIFGWSFTVGAQSTNKYTGSLLWKVSGKDLKKPSYILGTHHLVPTSFIDSIPQARTSFKATKQMVGEILLSDIPEIQAKIQAKALMPSGTSYSTLLSPEDYASLDEGLKDLLGAGLDQLGTMNPGMLNTICAMVAMSKAYPGYNPQQNEAIDVYLQNEAVKNKKTVLGLETVEDQIHVLFEMAPLQKQAEDLVCMVNNFDWSISLLQEITQYYKAGKLTEIHNASLENSKDPCQFSEEQQNELLKYRNDLWLKQLPGIMQKAPSFIAVGALHLTGEDGLLYQLNKMGYTVEAVK